MHSPLTSSPFLQDDATYSVVRGYGYNQLVEMVVSGRSESDPEKLQRGSGWILSLYLSLSLSLTHMLTHLLTHSLSHTHTHTHTLSHAFPNPPSFPQLSQLNIFWRVQPVSSPTAVCVSVCSNAIEYSQSAHLLRYV